jgi:hypothetical protein
MTRRMLFGLLTSLTAAWPRVKPIHSKEPAIQDAAFVTADELEGAFGIVKARMLAASATMGSLFAKQMYTPVTG